MFCATSNNDDAKNAFRIPEFYAIVINKHFFVDAGVLLVIVFILINQVIFKLNYTNLQLKGKKQKFFLHQFSSNGKI